MLDGVVEIVLEQLGVDTTDTDWATLTTRRRP